MGNGNYEIVNEASRKVLDNSQLQHQRDRDHQYSRNGGTNQQWHQTADASDTAINSAYSHKELDNSQQDQQQHRRHQWPPTGSANQQWKLLPASNAPAVTEYVVNASSGKVLDDPNSSTSNGTPIHQ